MAARLYDVAIFLLLLTVSRCSLFDPSANRELELYKKQVEIVHNMLLAEKCPDPGLKAPERREILSSSDSDSIHVAVQKKLYGWLVDKLTECRRNKDPPLPYECENAVNLTESWRLDHNASDIKPTINNHNQYWYNCDSEDMIKAGRPWFRFSESAGNKLADWCIPHDSCGTSVSLWSDDTMPSDVGVVTAFSVYGEYEGNCKNWAFNASVVRCSDAAGDFAYKYDDDYGCFLGFCGMTV